MSIDNNVRLCYTFNRRLAFSRSTLWETHMKTVDTEVVVFTRSDSLPKLYIKTANNHEWRTVKDIFNFNERTYLGCEIYSGFSISFGNAVVEVTKDTVLSEKDPMLN